MTVERERARREASEWHVLLHDAPEDAKLRAQFADWLDADAGNAKAWDSINLTFGAIRGTAVGVPGGERDTAAVAVAAGRRKAGSRAWRRRSVAGVVAACAVLLVVLWLPDLRIRMESDYSTGTAETETVELADGSTVLLAPESAIALTFVDGRRAVRLLSGTAHFRVVPSRARRFVVDANGVTATVLGTAFDVALHDGGALVQVRSGHVQVADSENPSMAACDLHAGDWVWVDAESRVFKGQVSPDYVGGWQSGKLTVHGEPIAAVVARIRPWYSGMIVLMDDALGARRVTGVYDLRDPRTALEALVSPYGGAVTQVTPWGLLISGS